jgi:hypothetical protein
MYDGTLYSKKRKILSFVTTWMDLESLMLDEINQTQEEKY